MTLALSPPRAGIRRPLVAPLLLLGGLAALVVIGPLVIPHDPAAQDLVRTLEGPSPASASPPGSASRSGSWPPMPAASPTSRSCASPI